MTGHRSLCLPISNGCNTTENLNADTTSTKVIPVTAEEYGLSKAARPANSRLDKSKLTENGFKRLPEWKDALGRYLKEIQY